MPDSNLPLSIQDIQEASENLSEVCVPTPLLTSEKINKRLNSNLFFKCEMFQPVGSFKIRGAWNFMSRLPSIVNPKGVVAFSSGNHAQAVSWVARRLNLHATIIMPKQAPKIKIKNTHSLGAELILYDRFTEDREVMADTVVKNSEAKLVPPYDHPLIMAGQGTIGIEIINQLEQRGVAPDMVLVPCSGGGLVAGCSVAIHSRFPNTNVFAVEPEHYNDTKRSLDAGKRIRIEEKKETICDALLVSEPGKMTFEINKQMLAGCLTASDYHVKAAINILLNDLKVVAEPSGAIGLAALLAGCLNIEGKNVCVVLSGGNADPSILAENLISA